VSARAGYSFFQTLIAANSTTALDRTFIVLVTTWSKVAGLVIVGLAGQWITTALGRSLPGSTSSILRLWPLRLPLDSGVVWWWDDWDTVPPGASRSRGAPLTRTGTA